MGRAEIPYDEQKAEIVKSLSKYGVPQDQIAAVIKMSRDTMLKLYKQEMLEGAAEANAAVTKRLYQKALEGDTASLIFWIKCRCRWRESDKNDPVTASAVQIVLKNDLDPED